MDFLKDFALTGTGKGTAAGTAPKAASASANQLGPLSALPGTWKGTGFNQIWRPFHHPQGQDRFLELNFTTEQLEFDLVPGPIPNRGLLQGDVNLHGVRYLQQVLDAHAKGPNGKPAGLHVEPGLWLHVPALTHPSDPSTVARLGTIPHGTVILAQGQAVTTKGGPAIQKVDLTPFKIGQPTQKVPFPEQDLSKPSHFRTDPANLPGLTQAQLDDVNGFLTQGLAGKTVQQTITLTVSTSIQQVHPPSSGGGTANIAFLDGVGGKPNAHAAQMDAIFWIETLAAPGGAHTLQLQYSQRVLLNFNGLTWPHISVATLTRQPD